MDRPFVGPSRTGILGLDGVLHGGLPRGRATVVVGNPGSGKTLLGLQFLYNGALHDNEPGLHVSFEEAPEALRANAAALGIPVDDADDQQVRFIDARPNLDAVRDGLFDIGGLIAILQATIVRYRIQRIVFDGLDALFAVTGSDVASREFRRLLQLVHSHAVTSIVCLKPGAGDEEIAREFGVLEFAADAVIRLGYRLVDGLMQRLLRVVKIRGAGFAAGEHPFIISPTGFEVAYAPNEKSAPVLAAERVSTGIASLDDMLEGGLLRSSCTLVSGLPGTAKSTLGAAFVAAALARGERCLLVALDEPAAQLLSNVRSVGIDLAPYLASGQLRTLSLNAGSAIADDHYLTIEQAVTAFSPSILVVDPLSAFQKAGGADVAILVVERLTELVRGRGMVALFTAVSSSSFGELESTSAHVSTIADSWIHLSFAVKGGERNRTLTIVKSRGTAHSNQMREMTLSREGIALEDVYQLEGAFLLGTARLQREQLDKQLSDERAARVKALLHELSVRKEAAASKLRDTERELSEIDDQMTHIIEQSQSLAATEAQNRHALAARRGSAARDEG